MTASILRNTLIRELFVRTADENYITARWCAMNGLCTDFLWLAVHSLEKYLKAVLLSNGLSAKNYGHDIHKLYMNVQRIAGLLLPDQLEKPADLCTGAWFARSAEQFILHLLRNGNADNRYLIFGWNTFTQDLHMLDAMIFAVRRLICNIDGRFFPLEDGWSDTTHREMLTDNPGYFDDLGMPLDKLIKYKDRAEIRRVAFNLNMSFAPADYQHVSMQGTNSSRKSPIGYWLLDRLDNCNADDVAEVVDAAEWLLKHVQLPRGRPDNPGVVEQIEQAVKSARIRQ